MKRRRIGIAAALLACALALPGCAPSRATQAALQRAPGAGPLALDQAQQRVPFVIYLPTALPQNAGQARLAFAPEITRAGAYAPPRIYAAYPGGLTLWQLPRLGRSLERGAIPVRFGDRLGWSWPGPRPADTTVEWVQGDTQLGLTGALEPAELLKIAGSAVQAAPQALMAPASQALQTRWGLSQAPPITGGIGVLLAPGLPSVVLWVAPDSPAARAGLRPRDRPVAIGGQPASELDGQAALAHALRGEPGSQVRLTYVRGRAAPTQVAITRRRVPAYRWRDVTLAEARCQVQFRLLTPQHLPRGYRLLSVALITRDDAPFEVRQAYSGAGRPLLTIAQRGQGAFVADRRGQVTAIGSATGRVVVEDDDVTAAWAQHGTQVMAHLSGFEPAVLLNVARSLH